MEILNINNENGMLAYVAACSGIDYVMQDTGKAQALFKCTACVRTDGTNLVLISYNTPIALYTPADGIIWDCLRVKYGYTATSSQHIYKFKKWLEQKNFKVNGIKRFTE